MGIVVVVEVLSSTRNRALFGAAAVGLGVAGKVAINGPDFTEAADMTGYTVVITGAITGMG